MTDFPPPLPTGPIREVLPGIFFVTGQMVVGEGESEMRFSRNMTIVHDGSAITLVNTVRLDTAGLTALDALGPVKNVVRLGAHHGRDDAFYLDRYGAKFWAVPGMEFNRAERLTNPLASGKPGPCTNSSAFIFETSSKPEAILRLGRHEGVLITCDSLQNFNAADAFFNETATERMQAGGFLRPANIGPGWRAATDPKPEDFARLKRLEFRHVLSAHGDPCLHDASSRYAVTFKNEFGV